MLKNIKKKIRNFFDLRVDRIVQNQNRLQQSNFAFNQISQLFKDSTFIPFSAWAISPNAILHILNDILINKRKAIIEFGAGASTFYIARLIKSLNLDAIFYTVESDPDWAKELDRQLNFLKLENHVKIILSPVVDVPVNLSFKDQKTWYDINIINNSLDKQVKFDLIIVDGPVGANTPFSRFSAIPFLKDKLNSHYSILLDDVNRSHEKIITEEWIKILDCKSIYYDRYVILTNTENFDTLPFQLGINS